MARRRLILERREDGFDLQWVEPNIGDLEHVRDFFLLCVGNEREIVAAPVKLAGSCSIEYQRARDRHVVERIQNLQKFSITTFVCEILWQE